MSQDQEVLPAPGYYQAKILNYGITKTKAGDPSPAIIFEVTLVDGSKHRVPWKGSLKDGPARNISLKALAVCGFSNVGAFSYLANGLESGLLDTNKEVQITVEHETGLQDPEKPNEEPKRYARVRWVNESGGGKFKHSLDVQETAVLLKGMGLEADFMKIAKENGYKVSSDPIKRMTNNEPAEDIQIPF